MPKKLILGAALTDDPVEEHIIRHLGKMLNQNKQLQEQIRKTKVWVADKPVANWVPFDFFHYFCTLYETKFGEPFNQKGRLVHAYEKIEAFIRKNKISNEEYKQFLDRAFSVFTSLSRPSIGSICNPGLYNKLMRASTKEATVHDLNDLDIQLQKENERIKKDEEKYGIVPGMRLKDLYKRMEELNNAKP